MQSFVFGPALLSAFFAFTFLDSSNCESQDETASRFGCNRYSAGLLMGLV